MTGTDAAAPGPSGPPHSPTGTATRSTTASAILERLPLSRWHRVLVVLIGLGSFFDLYEVFLGGVLAPVLGKQFRLDSFGQAAVIGSGFLGMFVGAIALSVLADRIGRRRVFLLNLLTYSLFSLAAAFSPNIETFLVLRFLAGIGLGCELVLVDTYLAEFLPGRVRGRYTAWAYTVGFLGVPVAALLGGKLVAREQLAGIDGWRWLLVAGALGAVFVLLIRRVLPESPRWLESRGRVEEAVDVARRFAARSGHPVGPDPADGPAAARGPADGTAKARGSTDGPSDRTGPELDTRTARDVLRTAFSGVYRTRTIMLFVFQVLQTVAYYGFGTLVPVALVDKHFPIADSLLFSAFIYVGYPVGALISVPLVERFERKWLIVYSALAIAVLGLVFAASTTAWLIVTAGFVVTAVSNIFSNGFHIYQAEIFPTSIRSTASGTAYSLSRAVSAVLPFVAVPLLHSAGPVAVFGGSAVLIVLLCLDVGLLGPRAASGRALEEVGH